MQQSLFPRNAAVLNVLDSPAHSGLPLIHVDLVGQYGHTGCSTQSPTFATPAPHLVGMICRSPAGDLFACRIPGPTADSGPATTRRRHGKTAIVGHATDPLVEMEI